MTESDVLNVFRRSGALLEGHFRLSSGLHSPGYLQCALVLQHPKEAEALGAALAGLARPLIAFATSWWGVLACRFADRVGKGLRAAPRDAWLTLSVDPSRRGLAFGLHRSMDNLGAVLGPLVATALLAAGFSLRQVFLAAIVPALLVIVMSGSRGSFLLLTEFFRRRSAKHLKAVVFETDVHEMTTHRLTLHSATYRVLGFFIDGEGDKGPRSFEGYPCLGDYGTLLAFIARGLTDVVIISAHQLDDERLEELAGHCGVNGVALVTLRYALEPVDAADVAPQVAPRIEPT